MSAAEQYRASFDAEVVFSNGGSLRAEGFRVDLPGPTATVDEVAGLFVASLGLLMSERVDLANVRIFPEPHKGTRGGPSDPSAHAATQSVERRLVELSHVIEGGMTTTPGLPGPALEPHLTREASRAVYAPGVEFAIDRISLVGSTGTYLDAPYHRYAGTDDVSGLTIERVADLPAVVVRVGGSAVRGVDVGSLAALPVAGAAVLLHTGADRHFGRPEYARDRPYLTESGAQWLVAHGAALVGIDAANIDNMGDPARPAHSILLAAGIPIVENLTGLDQLPPQGARFTAAPPPVAGIGSFPVRAYAVIS